MKITAMIVDDNETDRYILRRWLKSSSHDVVITEATDGQNALEYFERSREAPPEGYPPTVIFLDINMPRVNGFEFLERFANMRRDHDLSSTVVVMFTSSPLERDRDQALRWDFVSEILVKGNFETRDIERILEAYHPPRAA